MKNIHFNVEKSEVVAIIGPSGSGKSTLLRCVNHLEEPTSGEIYVEGVLLNDKSLNKRAFQCHLNKIRTKVGMVFQQFNLFPHMTALENVMEAPVNVLKEAKETAEKMRECCWTRSVSERRRTAIREPSPGAEAAGCHRQGVGDESGCDAF